MEMETVYEIQRIKQVTVEVEEKLIMKSPEDAAELISKYIGDEDREVFLVLALTTINQVVAIHRCHVGTVNASIVGAKEVFKPCILNNASYIIIAHNHPGGSLIPSREDLEVTRKINEGGKLLDIQLLDHLIVTSNGKFISLKEKGYI